MTTTRRLFAYVLVAALASACSQRATAAKPPATEAAIADQGSGDSIFALDLALVDQDGHAQHLADLRGRTMVAAMMYASCTSVCPRITEDMKGIERQLGARAKGVTFVLFSLDPGRDTPASLRRFADEHSLDMSRWRLFATSEDGVRDLAAVLGVKYRRDPDGTIEHSAMIFVIDPQGVVRHRQVGLMQDPRELLAAIGG